jgi:hypothetical protein
LAGEIFQRALLRPQISRLDCRGQPKKKAAKNQLLDHKLPGAARISGVGGHPITFDRSNKNSRRHTMNMMMDVKCFTVELLAKLFLEKPPKI